jgi:uncharacterized protein CbrC (UPF0167 family)
MVINNQFCFENIANENEQQTWMRNTNESIHNQHDNESKHKKFFMKCLKCKH